MLAVLARQQKITAFPVRKLWNSIPEDHPMQSECEVVPIRRLWAAVLSQAITDALMPTSEAVRDGNHTAAWRWIGTRD